MGSIALVLFFILIALNLVGFYFAFILKEKKRAQSSKLKVSIESKEGFSVVNLFSFIREVLGFLCILVVILGIISFYYNREILLGTLLLVFFLASLFLTLTSRKARSQD